MSELRTDRTERTLTHIEAQLDQALADLKALKGAFPEDEFGNVDTLGHRRYHDEMIAAARAQTEFWTKLRQELIRKGIIWGVVAAFGLMIIGVSVKTGITWGGSK